MAQIFSIHESSFDVLARPAERGDEVLLLDKRRGRVERWRALRNPGASRQAVCLRIGGAYYRFQRVEYVVGKPVLARERCRCQEPTWREPWWARGNCACGKRWMHAHCRTCGRVLLTR